jgi:cell wall-associated NlpC family hydrolase
MTTPAEIILEAETWIGTPFKHQGRVKGVGVDCYGLVIEVARHFDLTAFKSGNYGRKPNPTVMWQALRTHMREISLRDLRPGAILFMAYEKEPMHLAIFDGENIIHALAIARKCVKQRLDSQLRSKIRGVFVFPGMID